MAQPDPSRTAPHITRPPTEEATLAGVMQENIRALVSIREQMAGEKSVENRVAGAITAFAGSMVFVYIHLLLFGGWILLNSGLIAAIEPWDPFPFVMLAMAASVEAIFLSTFVLIGQKRMTRLSERRAELDLQINLLAEHEITRLIMLTDAIARHLGVPIHRGPGFEDLKQNVDPDQVLREIDKAERQIEEPIPDDIPPV
jgi:uncharacterized membrane protein